MPPSYMEFFFCGLPWTTIFCVATANIPTIQIHPSIWRKSSEHIPNYYYDISDYYYQVFSWSSKATDHVPPKIWWEISPKTSIRSRFFWKMFEPMRYITMKPTTFFFREGNCLVHFFIYIRLPSTTKTTVSTRPPLEALVELTLEARKIELNAWVFFSPGKNKNTKQGVFCFGRNGWGGDSWGIGE